MGRLDRFAELKLVAQANVGIAMATGTNIGMESAGVTLVKGDLRGIARALRLSRPGVSPVHEDRSRGSRRGKWNAIARVDK